MNISLFVVQHQVHKDLYWSKFFGWVELAERDVFTALESLSMITPEYGQWVRLGRKSPEAWQKEHTVK